MWGSATSTPRQMPWAPHMNRRHIKHSAPTLVFDGEPLVGPWMKDPRRWQPGRREARHPLPGHVCLLAAPPQRASP
jgi:hypothetical protein